MSYRNNLKLVFTKSDVFGTHCIFMPRFRPCCMSIILPGSMLNQVQAHQRNFHSSSLRLGLGPHRNSGLCSEMMRKCSKNTIFLSPRPQPEIS